MPKKKMKSKAKPKKKKLVGKTKSKLKSKPKVKAKVKTKAKTKAKAKAKPKAKAKSRKKRSVPAAPVMPWRDALPGEKPLGVVEDYFAKISVIAFTLAAPLKIGERIHVRGHTTDLFETVGSMQIEHASVQEGKTKDGVGIKINGVCRKGDYVYKAPA